MQRGTDNKMFRGYQDVILIVEASCRQRVYFGNHVMKSVGTKIGLMERE